MIEAALMRELLKLDGPSESLPKKLSKKTPRSKLSDYARFRILHREFEGKFLPLFPAVIRSARFLIQSYRGWKPKR